MIGWPRRRRRVDPGEVEKLQRLEAAKQEVREVVARGEAVADELEGRKARNHLAEHFILAAMRVRENP